MKFIVERERILKPLQQLNGLLSGRPIFPILGNILFQVKSGILLLTSSNLEMEMIVRVELIKEHETGSITVSARKFFDICRGLPDGVDINVALKNTKMLISSGRSRFSLLTLSSENFPNIEEWKSKITLTLPQITLKYLIESTQFSMAHQDVRYCLNGMMFETQGSKLRTIATDGHRLSICSILIEKELPHYSVIVPRKCVLELLRILDGDEKILHLNIGTNNISIHTEDFIFTSKLIDGRFPDYRYALPKNPDKELEAICSLLKQAFSRASIISNEKFCGVRIYITYNQMKIVANNTEQEESEELLDVKYHGKDLEIGINVGYILDVLNTLKCEKVRFFFTDSVSSVQIENASNRERIYIIMPIRL